MVRINITKHAYDRMKERLGLSKKLPPGWLRLHMRKVLNTEILMDVYTSILPRRRMRI